jgi:geranylgeranyl diphosphate synthase, type II
MHGRANLPPTEGQCEGQPQDKPGHDAPVASVGSVTAKLRDRVNQRLETLVAPPQTAPVSLNGAIRHALLAPGKRVRPLLTMLTAAEFGADPLKALDAGCAVELVHTASLVLDDLPCMDDASTRRGLPATHAAYGEATAVLAAIAMLTRAFGVLATMADIPLAVRAELAAILSVASGAEGLAAGQERDLNDRGPADPLAKINDINNQKTGALFIAAIQMGGRIAGADASRMAALTALGREVGLAFQALDDVIDLSQSAGEAGKDTGKDAGKATVATVMGLEPARAEVERHMQLALDAIAPFTQADGPLRSYVAAMFAQASGAASLKAANL